VSSTDRDLVRSVRDLAKSAGLGTVASVEPIEAGGNNRAYRARTGSRDLFVKQYFRSPGDPRDRFTSEVAFARFAWDRGVRAIAEPLGADATSGVAMCAWIEGRRPAAGEVAGEHVEAAIAFWESLNTSRGHPQAATLGPASEACFTIADHLRLVSDRISALTERAEAPARTFARERLSPAWIALRGRILTRVRERGLALEAAIPAAERCLSPSDFGFHNVLVTTEGRLVFHDFEYAGWDDPAKLVGDFFAQIAVPVSSEHEARFKDAVTRALGLDERARERIALLRPLFRLKWCCIALNEFLPADRDRREFAGRAEVSARRKVEQLVKAEAALAAAVAAS
jgi:hypothetical protein